MGHLHGKPVTICLESELKHPVGLALTLRYQTYGILRKATVYDLRVHIGGESVPVFLGTDLPDQTVILFNRIHFFQILFVSFLSCSSIWGISGIRSSAVPITLLHVHCRQKPVTPHTGPYSLD